MPTVRVGATKKFADNWEHIFGAKKRQASVAKSPAKAAKKSAKKKSAGGKSVQPVASRKARKKTR